MLSGPNLGSLGTRQPELYGRGTLADIHAELAAVAAELGADLRCEQSNHEGTLIDLIEEETGRSDGMVINPGGLAHTSVALADAVRGFAGPVVEVHLTNTAAREEYRHRSHVGAASDAFIAGAGAASYALGLRAACTLIERRRETAR